MLTCGTKQNPAAITFGNNLLAALPPRWTDNGRSKRARMITRLIAAVPPLVLGSFIYELSTVISVTGLAGKCRKKLGTQKVVA